MGFFSSLFTKKASSKPPAKPPAKIAPKASSQNKSSGQSTNGVVVKKNIVAQPSRPTPSPVPLPPKIPSSQAVPPGAAQAKPAPQLPQKTAAGTQIVKTPTQNAENNNTKPETGPRPVMRRIIADEAKIQELLTYSGMVLTGENGRIETNSMQRKVAALLDGGQFIVHKDNPLSPESMEVRQKISVAGLAIKIEYLVDLEVIRKIYESYEKRTGQDKNKNKGGESLQKMQQEVLSLIFEAAAGHCSDIHVVVGRHEAIIRMRQDGVMTNVKQMRADWASDLCSAAFNMADASDASYRVHEYQGARISEVRTPLPEGVQAIRLQFNPLPNGGRYMVARLLYANSVSSYEGDVDTLGYAETHIEQLRRMRRKPFGINIISGPTGSGKSTTLQRALTALMREKRNQVNVITIEDPPEYVIAGAQQLPVLNASTEEERNEKFRAAIAASLRSDPDIIMIGEIRDKSSSALAFTAAMTGHQVWASLHTNDAISILDRLRDQGVDVYKLSDHTLVTGLIGQRLIRKLCPHCRINLKDAERLNMISRPLYLGLEALAKSGADLRGIHFAGPERTSKCTCREGYSGREVVAETICPDPKFMRFIREGNKIDAVEYWLNSLGGITMLEHAIQKALIGMCDPRDVEDKAGEFLSFDGSRAPKLLSIMGNAHDAGLLSCGVGAPEEIMLIPSLGTLSASAPFARGASNNLNPNGSE